ncbi:hypothetical protein P7K49_018926 [Saguinus oedipus]|uniref:Uncharacterized protein n=1 Tax=Saguinus oedipus TaxID=9490 RepID=A0ABQ9UWR5_SAGOE|nr:hypothetical protein P7K49_018926 [Saguinus oedipus]
MLVRKAPREPLERTVDDNAGCARACGGTWSPLPTSRAPGMHCALFHADSPSPPPLLALREKLDLLGLQEVLVLVELR